MTDFLLFERQDIFFFCCFGKTQERIRSRLFFGFGKIDRIHFYPAWCSGLEAESPDPGIAQALGKRVDRRLIFRTALCGCMTAQNIGGHIGAGSDDHGF